ncbi:major facilitator superfamily domain-containing protein [Ditylenchus destructor]|uniref:Major facilitator superfamily domain-containing protein n=1 Tax=Ditylenchus destructor TaxID=166010 RepID=A0AAD4R5Q8_9BILA|nr:major facilitator superfamily domain-containing protein [Ditylenchus destructor]
MFKSLMTGSEKWKPARSNGNMPANEKSLCREPDPLAMPENESDEEDRLEDLLEDAGIIKPPDGGYGWIVVLASFFINMIVDGVIFSISESIVPLWEQEFNTTTSMVTVAPSLLAGFYLLSGPISSALSNSFGCNKVVSQTIYFSSKSTNFIFGYCGCALPVLYFTFGIVGGIGYGLIFLPAIVIVGQYFSARRALATGMAVCGSGIGTSLFSWLNPIILTLVDRNWRVFLVIIAMITMLCAIFGYFFKPLEPSKSQVEEVTKIASKYIGRVEDDEIRKSEGDQLGEECAETTTSPHIVGGVAIERFGRSNGNFNVSRIRRLDADRPFISTMELHIRQAGKKNASQQDVAASVTKQSMADLNRPLSKMDIFYTGSTSTLAKHQSIHRKNSGPRPRPRTTSFAENKSTIYLSVAGLPTTDDGSTPTWSQGITATLRSLLDISLMKSPSFLILALSGFLTLFCFFVPFMFIASLARQNGVPESLTKYLVVIIGLVNLCSRVLCGLISDHPKVDPLVVSNFAVILGGTATVFAPFLTTFWQFGFLYCVPFAFGAACFAALRSIICVELLGIDKLTNAYGMLMLFMGIAALIGPPFAALLKNLTNSFNMSFYVMGGIMVLSGLISLPLRRINKYEMSRQSGTSSPLEMEPLNNENEKQNE